MKQLLSVIIFLTSVNVFAGEPMKSMEDDNVSASLITSAKFIKSKDQNMHANLVSVFRGSAAGLSSLIIALSTSGSPEGDSLSYEIENLIGEASNAVLLKKSSTLYRLKLDIVVSKGIDDNGHLMTEKKTVSIDIKRDVDGNITSVERN
ncbi:MAG: hypothetical protein IT287_00810 [Bdellovibrionaceae bacterium]|nr:hypothetical protein [Pseudobdellovibrionaceae bacterium]